MPWISRINIVPIMTVLGGSTELSLDDKDAIEAADIGLRELRDRTMRQGTLDENSAFVRGEIVRARYQVYIRYLIGF